jgi:hypothetical protein
MAVEHTERTSPLGNDRIFFVLTKLILVGGRNFLGLRCFDFSAPSAEKLEVAGAPERASWEALGGLND